MHLQLKNIGQITDADIRFGDLTVFVGPQATGKTIALEFLKLAVDLDGIQETMGRYGLDWSGELRDFFDLYFGEGMQGLWQDGQSEFRWRGSPVPLNLLLKRSPRRKVGIGLLHTRSAGTRFTRRLASAILGLLVRCSICPSGVQREPQATHGTVQSWRDIVPREEVVE